MIAGTGNRVKFYLFGTAVVRIEVRMSHISDRLMIAFVNNEIIIMLCVSLVCLLVGWLFVCLVNMCWPAK